MSHFSLLVVGDDVDNQLIPFQEHACTGKCPQQYMKFEDCEDQYLKDYGTDEVSEFYCASSSSQGMVVSEAIYNKVAATKVGKTVTLAISKSDLGGFASYFELDKYYRCGHYTGTPSQTLSKNHAWVKVVKIYNTDHPNKNVCFEGTIEVERVNKPKKFPVKEKYATFEQYMEEYCGYEDRDPETGRYGRWENPNAKWDWYQIGGRFDGRLLLKNGVKVNVARKGDVDWETMKNDAGQSAANRYDTFQRHFGELPVNLSWEVVREKFVKDIEGARTFYNSQERVVQYREKSRQLNLGDGFYDGPDDFLISKDQYVENARRDAIRTFAVLINGTWNEKGEMGWFGMVSNEKDSDDWRTSFETILASISDDTKITVVDCHI